MRIAPILISQGYIVTLQRLAYCLAVLATPFVVNANAQTVETTAPSVVKENTSARVGPADYGMGPGVALTSKRAARAAMAEAETAILPSTGIQVGLVDD